MRLCLGLGLNIFISLQAYIHQQYNQ